MFWTPQRSNTGAAAVAADAETPDKVGEPRAAVAVDVVTSVKGEELEQAHHGS